MTNLKICILLALVSLIFCCKKDEPNPPGSITPKLFKIRQGTNIATDTFNFLFYYPDNKIKGLLEGSDSTFPVIAPYDSAVYDVNGRISRITGNLSFPSVFSYNADGTLAIIDGSYTKYKFEYAGGVLSKKRDSSQVGSGYVLWQTTEYVVTNGNITTKRVYANNGTLVRETTYTYGSQLNPFKDLSLFNNYNTLGTDPLINIETYFNANLLKGFWSNGVTATINYTFDSRQNIIKMIGIIPYGASDFANDVTFTFELEYR